MNQILVSEKVIVTPGVKRKKKFYKCLFIGSLVGIVVLLVPWINTEYTQRKAEAYSKDILSQTSFTDTTTTKDDVLVIALNDRVEEVEQKQVQPKSNATVYKTASGDEYTVDSILNIPSLGINYPVLSKTSDELLKISLNKFWGGDPNSVGNYCIVGHNYDGKDILFGKLNRIQNGDVVELEDPSGKKVTYKVYNIFIIDPTDVACTSQLTNGKTEMTLITCADGGKTRLVVKCRAVDA